uniref:Rho GTPase-activating protein SYDE2 n=1 Tax=Phallusia mammillata TaxID=59560 RepID=A0A6F9DU95_9ASCI|nr:rho GTPase-activating protein SYDE2 [Phallusia mammillata]
MSEVLNNTVEMAPTINQWDVHETTFKRSQSMPPERRKRRLQQYIPDSTQTRLSESSETNDQPNGNAETKGVEIRRNKNGFKGMSFRGRKTDVRVSTINPDQLFITNEMKSMLQNGGKPPLQNGSMSHANGVVTKPQTPVNRTKHSKGNGLVKMLQGGVRRISSLSEKHGPSTILTKTIEIDRSKDGSLGIFIKKRKVPKQFDNGAAKQGIFVSRLDTSCKVSRENLLHVGDQILSINNVDIVDQDVKMVAGMMCLPNNLVLKVRSSHKSTSRPKNYQVIKNPQLQRIVEGKSSDVDKVALPNSNHNVVVAEPSNKTATLNSMYDNDRVDLSLPVKNKKPNNNLARNSVQIRFDESFQILLDAIADCEKPKNVNNNNCSSEVIHNSKGVDDANFQSDLLSSTTAQSEDIPEDCNSLVNDILSTINGQGTPTELKTNPGHPDVDNYSSSNGLRNVPTTSDSNSAHFHTTMKLIDDPDYDEVPTTDDESSYSCNDEVNVDAFGDHIKYSRKYGQHEKNPSTSTSSSSLNSQGVETVSHHTHMKGHNPDLTRSLSDAGWQSSADSVIHQQPCCKKASMPRFPVAHTDFTTRECSCMSRQSSNSINSITVDKKRQWLESGPQVSDELQMRLDGLHHSTKEGKLKELPPRKVSVTSQKNGDLKVDTKKRNSCKRRPSESSSSSSGHSSNSPGIPRSHKSSLDSPSSVSDFTFHRKNSIKNPMEKSAKSMLSVSSPSSPSPKTFIYSDKSENDSECSVPHPKAEDSGITATEKVPQTTKVSHPTLLVNGSPEEPGNSNTSNRSFTAVKITSPSRSRKKNWGKKFTKKFKLGGSSENSMSEYACWMGEDEQQKVEGNLLADSSKVSTQHNLQKIINKSDSAVLNRYHLDISMAHQRRLSRQLEWDNVLPDPSIKALTLSQFKKYKPVSALHHQFLPAIDGCLVITLYGVRELKKTLCEAYCLVQVDNATTKRIGTTMQTCRGAVAWNQCFELMVNKARDLHVTLYTWETRGGKHKVCSYATLNLPTLIQGAKLQSNFSERLAVRLEPRGTLYMKVALEKNPSSPGPLVFGADLQSIVDRESSGYGIPSLVHSCIEEVEKRGMQVVGIYRLCGSAIVKRELRRKVEEAKGVTLLTSDNYPDVNVITGILKDFLRELPQPLFPPELLEAVTTAMEKNPGPTPATVVKEPFAPDPTLTTSIPGSQPATEEEQKMRTSALLQHIKVLSAAPAERATLYALLNHLKKVAMHHEQNKMTCQNLAVCFGPVLLGPVNASLGNGIDLSAAIGFKRHIQVLNYMLSNWPSEPVAVPRAPSPETNDTAENRNSVNRMSCVSLTRRLSRVFIVDESEARTDDAALPSNCTDKRGTLISMGRSESLTSILETSDQFEDPQLDLRRMQESEDL